MALADVLDLNGAHEVATAILREGLQFPAARLAALATLARIELLRDRIMSIASTIEEQELRDSWLTNIAPNARTVALAREGLGE